MKDIEIMLAIIEGTKEGYQSALKSIEKDSKLYDKLIDRTEVLDHLIDRYIRHINKLNKTK